MTVKAIITIDTEEDTWDQYSSTCNPVDNIQQLPKLQHLFDKYGAKPTYLVNYPVSTQKESVRVINNLIENGMCEIGAHCHPWNTPPFEEPINKINSMLCNLQTELQYKKIHALTESIEKAFGIMPNCFRAGRWGFGSNTAFAIERLGYKIDTSISPTMNWSRQEGPDFSKGHFGHYRFNPENIFYQSHYGRLLEIPPTIGFFQKNFRYCAAIRTLFEKPFFHRIHVLGALDRTYLLNRRWLSPELSASKDLIRLSDSFVSEGHTFLNMSFHSTSLLPGKSPFVKNQTELTDFIHRIESFLKYVVSKGYEFSYLSGFTDK